MFTDDDISEASQETTQETVYDLTDIKVSVQAVSLCLNKEEYSLAKAKVSSLNCHLKLEGPNQDIAGSIGKFSLMDMSPNGKLYKEKWVYSCLFGPTKVRSCAVGLAYLSITAIT